MPLPQIIVYRIDRLTRSLSDFAKLIDRFDAHDVARNRVRVCCANAADPKLARIDKEVNQQYYVAVWTLTSRYGTSREASSAITLSSEAPGVPGNSSARTRLSISSQISGCSDRKLATFFLP